jgi:hypothetical protein
MHHHHYYMSPGWRNFLYVCYIGAYVFAGFTLFSMAKETENWLPTRGVVQDNTVEKRTIAYRVGKNTYRTSNENLLNMLEQKINFSIPYSRPGQSLEIRDGINTEIGRSVTVYYNPKNTTEAVVLPGWSAPVVIVGICSGIPLFLMAWLSLFGGWNLDPCCGEDW